MQGGFKRQFVAYWVLLTEIKPDTLDAVRGEWKGDSGGRMRSGGGGWWARMAKKKEEKKLFAVAFSDTSDVVCWKLDRRKHMQRKSIAIM